MDPREVILVTGANTGLGYQIIRALCGSNKEYNILLAGRSLTKVQQAVKLASEEFPSSRSNLGSVEVDIKNDDSIQKAFEEVKARFGRVDALINNAGMCRRNTERSIQIANSAQAHSSTNRWPQEQ